MEDRCWSEEPLPKPVFTARGLIVAGQTPDEVAFQANYASAEEAWKAFEEIINTWAERRLQEQLAVMTDQPLVQ